MKLLSTASVLLAQFSNWKRMGDGLRGSRTRLEFSDLLPYVIGITVLGLVGWAYMAYRKRNDYSIACNDAHKLFLELCDAHQLDRASQKILHQLAQSFGLAQPAEVFVRPSVFTAERLPEHLRSEQARIETLRSQLFR